MQNYKFIVKVIGGILTLVSLFFLIKSFNEHYESILFSFKQTIFIFIFIIGIVLYLITFLIVVVSWYIQLNKKYPRVNLLELLRVIGVSQIGKYFPGNIFHIASRFYLSKEIGLNARDITNSLIFETILIIISALFVGSLYFYFHVFPVIDININIYWMFVLVGVIFVTFYFLDIRNSYFELLSGTKLFLIGSVFIISHFILGSIIYLVDQFMIFGNSPFIIMTSMLALSFVAGYITPGSPGGIGIREFVFIKLAMVEMDESSALSIVLSLRLITICGDLIIYLISLNIKKLGNLKNK